MQCEREHNYQVVDEHGARLSRECFTPGQALLEFAMAGDDAHEIHVAHRTDGTPCPAKQQGLADVVAEITELVSRMPAGGAR